MNSGSNYDKIWRKMKGAKLPEIDIAVPVMKRIHGLREREAIRRRRAGARPVWFAVAVLLFAAIVSVSAAAMFVLPTEWNGIRLFLIPADSEQQSARQYDKPETERILEELENSAGVWETLATEEAEKSFPFPILRPQSAEWIPARSFGVKKFHEAGSSACFYDFYEQGEEWIVVQQNLDRPMTDTLQNPEVTMSLTFVGAWEPVRVNAATLAMFIRLDHANLLTVRYKTEDQQVAVLTISGNVSKERLVQLAQTYVGSAANGK